MTLKALFLSTTISLLSGCGGLPIATPFTITAAENENTEPHSYLMVVSEAVINQDSGNKSKFYEYTDGVVAQIEQSKGLYGYSIRRELFGNRAWTLTVWRDEASLGEFKTTGTHLTAMANAQQLLDSAAFVRHELRAEQLPPSWDDALALLTRQGRRYSFNE